MKKRVALLVLGAMLGVAALSGCAELVIAGAAGVGGGYAYKWHQDKVDQHRK